MTSKSSSSLVAALKNVITCPLTDTVEFPDREACGGLDMSLPEIVSEAVEAIGPESQLELTGTTQINTESKEAHGQEAFVKPIKGRPRKSYTTRVREFTEDDRNGGLATEFERFCGVLLLMGLVQLSNVTEYWSGDLGIEAISKAMSLNRFQFLMRHLHFIDNTSVHPDQKKRINYGRSVYF